MSFPKLHFSYLLFLILIAFGVLWPQLLADHLAWVASAFARSADWLVMGMAGVCLLMCLVLIFSPVGSIRLGTDKDQKPDYSYPAWLSMLFAAGMGVGLVFHGAAEPLYHYTSPPAGQQPDMTRAMTMTFLHWGLRAWAVYAIVALAISYFTFRLGRPMLISSPLASIRGVALPHWVAVVIDTFSIIAVVFGIIASLGHGVIFMHNGLSRFLPVDDAPFISYALITGLLGVAYIASSSTRISKGIKWLSLLNMKLCIALFIFIMVMGPTLLQWELFGKALVDYLSVLPKTLFDVDYITSDPQWNESWPITYYMWWFAWSPFVGVFIARVSRGRTIREFLCGVFLVPVMFSFLWFAVLGGTAFDLLERAPDTLNQVPLDHFPSVTYAVLDALPLSHITSVLTLFLVFMFLVTSADSGTYVLGMFTSRGAVTPPQLQRFFWGALVGGVTLGLLLLGQGLGVMKSFMVVASIPYLFLMVLFMISLAIALWREGSSKNDIISEDASASEVTP